MEALINVILRDVQFNSNSLKLLNTSIEFH